MRMLKALKGLLMGIVIGWIIYRSHLWMVFFASITGLYQYMMYKENNHKLKHEFRMFLSSLYTELVVGNTMYYALQNTYRMVPLSNKKLMVSVNELISEIEMGQSEGLAWTHFSDKLKLDICTQFVEGLVAAYHTGSETSIVVRESINVLTDQLDLELEIDVILSAKKFEFTMMMYIPVGLIGALSYTDYHYMSPLYETITGRVVMTGVLILMGISYFVGKTIIDIGG